MTTSAIAEASGVALLVSVVFVSVLFVSVVFVSVVFVSAMWLSVSGLGQVGDDAAAGLVAALERGFADDVELPGVAGLRQRFLLPLAPPQEAPQRSVDDGDLAAARVAASPRVRASP